MRSIFLSAREGGKMYQPTDVNGNYIENLRLPTEKDHATSKSDIDDNFLSEKEA